jgi:hypothetical protein
MSFFVFDFVCNQIGGPKSFGHFSWKEATSFAPAAVDFQWRKEMAKRQKCVSMATTAVDGQKVKESHDLLMVAKKKRSHGI